MNYNEFAVIIPIQTRLKEILRAVPMAEDSYVPDNYSRGQALSEGAIRALVFEAHDRTYISYGFDSPDFPLCADFASCCASDVLKASIKIRLAVRPLFGVVYYTKKNGDRHAINFTVVTEGGDKFSVLFFEPQSDTWMASPKDCNSIDEYRML